MIFGEWIKENRFIRENRVLLVVFPLVALLMGGFGSLLLAVKTNENILCLSKPFHWYSKEKPEAVIISEVLISPREIIKEKRRRKKSTYKTGVTRSRVMKKGILSRMSRPVTASTILNADPFGGGYRSYVTQGATLQLNSNYVSTAENMKQNIKWMFNVPEIETEPVQYYKRPMGAIATRMLRTPPEQCYGFSFTLLQRGTGQNTHHTTAKVGRKASVIRDCVEEKRRELNSMYTRARQKDPSLSGKLKVRFTIDGQGKITASTIINSTLHNKSFEKKIIKNIESWEFGNSPHPGEVIEVTYPFVFVENK